MCIANAGLIAAPDGVTAIDALFTPTMTHALLNEANRVAAKPVHAPAQHASPHRPYARKCALPRRKRRFSPTRARRRRWSAWGWACSATSPRPRRTSAAEVEGADGAPARRNVRRRGDGTHDRISPGPPDSPWHRPHARRCPRAPAGRAHPLRRGHGVLLGQPARLRGAHRQLDQARRADHRRDRCRRHRARARADRRQEGPAADAGLLRAAT